MDQLAQLEGKKMKRVSILLLLALLMGCKKERKGDVMENSAFKHMTLQEMADFIVGKFEAVSNFKKIPCPDDYYKLGSPDEIAFFCMDPGIVNDQYTTMKVITDKLSGTFLMPNPPIVIDPMGLNATSFWGLGKNDPIFRVSLGVTDYNGEQKRFFSGSITWDTWNSIHP